MQLLKRAKTLKLSSSFLTLLLGGVFFCALIGSHFYAHAEEEATPRYYEYAHIIFDIAVERDTTVRVSERQKFLFTGEYHQAVRYIPLDRIDAITHIEVIDADTKTPLRYSASRLSKTNPESWGYYTTYRENGNQYIEWYYNEKDSAHEWELRYTLHGALSFYKDHDELYWDLFDAYDVPIGNVEATVSLPPNDFLPSEYEGTLYLREEPPRPITAGGDKTFLFRVEDSVSPQSPVTIAAGWPKGIIDEAAYWRDFLSLFWGYLWAVLMVLLAIIFSLVYWYRAEIAYKGKQSIIPEYAPPAHLRPAMVDVLVRERVSSHAWPATVVDLAVRGYLTIEELPATRLEKIGATIIKIVLFCASLFPMVIFGIIAWSTLHGGAVWIGMVMGILILISYAGFFFGDKERLHPAKQYAFTRTTKSEGDLEEYEEDFLDALFNGAKNTSTKELRVRGRSTSRELFLKMQDAEKGLLEEVEHDTKGYAVPLSRGGIFVAMWIVGFFGMPILFVVAVLSQWAVALIATACAIAFSYGAMLLNPRLNAKGNRLKEQVLGFKLYLETAERFRMQNLTPDTFEKYLPYAMVFGVEKKWARAFSGFTMQPPTWYSGGSFHGAGASGAPSFSASAFSASLSSSFSSAFASSGGSGASGGGGGAGGGGGGGGGGAS